LDFLSFSPYTKADMVGQDAIRSKTGKPSAKVEYHHMAQLPTDLLSSLWQLYGSNDKRLAFESDRYAALIRRFEGHFGVGRDPRFFSTPGRIEIGGNHTDHNHGCVLAAAIDSDAVAAASPAKNNRVTIISEGYPDPFVVDLEALFPVEKEKGTTHALIRGIAEGLVSRGYRIGGFDACIDSRVLIGSGLSSSAVIEVLIAAVFNGLFNDDQIPGEDLAGIGQHSENVYFGKPSGLMDQMACALGGILFIDFHNPASPKTERIDFDFGHFSYRILIVDTGGSHADLAAEYASIPEDMKRVAALWNQDVCRGISAGDLNSRIPLLRKSAGDRAILRALHFIQENDRVRQQVQALEKKAFTAFLNLVQESGDSSYKWLQNIYAARDPNHQPLSLALALTQQAIDGFGEGACRVHGGGFAGTILVFLPESRIDDYARIVTPVFGPNALLDVAIRSDGCIRL